MAMKEKNIEGKWQAHIFKDNVRVKAYVLLHGA